MTQEEVFTYVDAANRLALALEKDLKSGNVISNHTIIALSKFIAASQSMRKVVDMLESNKVKYN